MDGADGWTYKPLNSLLKQEGIQFTNNFCHIGWTICELSRYLDNMKKQVKN